jgi:hypothetical protein
MQLIKPVPRYFSRRLIPNSIRKNRALEIRAAARAFVGSVPSLHFVRRGHRALQPEMQPPEVLETLLGEQVQQSLKSGWVNGIYAKLFALAPA